MSSPHATGPYFVDSIRGISDVRYFYTGAEGPPLKAHDAAVQRYLDDKANGETGRNNAEAELARCRTLTAKLLGGTAEHVAVMANSSDALHRLVTSVDYRPGDNVVTTDLEFPSGVLSLLAMRARGVEVRVIPHDEWNITPERLAQYVDSRTRLVLASHVSYLSGTRIDPAAFKDVAHRVGARFVLDATQSLGVLRVSADDADAIVASTYKWLFGPHGIGLLYAADPEQFGTGEGVGWRSVQDLFSPDRFERFDLLDGTRRFELGYPSFPSVYMLNESLAMLTGVNGADLENYTIGLSAALMSDLESAGFTLITPNIAGQHGTNVSTAVTGDASAVAQQLLRLGTRAWGGDGRVRFSVHGFVSADDIEAAVADLRSAI